MAIDLRNVSDHDYVALQLGSNFRYKLSLDEYMYHPLLKVLIDGINDYESGKPMNIKSAVHNLVDPLVVAITDEYVDQFQKGNNKLADKLNTLLGDWLSQNYNNDDYAYMRFAIDSVIDGANTLDEVPQVKPLANAIDTWMFGTSLLIK